MKIKKESKKGKRKVPKGFIINIWIKQFNKINSRKSWLRQNHPQKDLQRYNRLYGKLISYRFSHCSLQVPLSL